MKKVITNAIALVLLVILNVYIWCFQGLVTYRWSSSILENTVLFRVILTVFADLIAILLYCNRKAWTGFVKDIFSNMKLILSLAKNDFKKKYAGSYLGTIWAFVQPVVTVLLYWFVFQKALNVGSQLTKAGIEVPYVLWLIAGIVPWFYFSEAWNNGTNALIDYSFLVKKIVFKINTLPFVKIISSLFVHVFFVVFLLILFALYGYFPSLYTLQVIYYSLCMIVFTLGLSYITAALVVFFKDLAQIITIVLQVLMWMTPILWNVNAINMPAWLENIVKINPVYYIVEGYRDALINHVWFWERQDLSIYFWGITGLIVLLGVWAFNKTKVHFADVL